MKFCHLIICLFPLLIACSNNASQAPAADTTQFSVKNELDAPRKDALLLLDAGQLEEKFSNLNWPAVKFTTGGKDIPFQINDVNGEKEMFALLLDFAAGEEKSIELVALEEGEKMPTFTKRTQAEIAHKVNGHWKDREYIDGEFQNVEHLSVPPEHTDHSWFIRYEGPGWESDLVGYRFYLDWRNATDIFGKKTTDMVLQDVGQDGFDSYHEPADWGMDVLKVGSSLGVGALGTWLGDKALRIEKTDSLSCTIVKNGAIESKIRTNYFGWQVDDITTTVTSDISIHAGSRLSRHDVMLSQALPNLCTGIVKHDQAKLIKAEDNEWGYLATWGQQSLAEDNLGMAILYRKQNLQQITEDEHSQVLVLSPENNHLTYYFLAAWEQEINGIKTEEAFVQYLNETIKQLSSPLQAKF